jgi:hypothetical protein
MNDQLDRLLEYIEETNIGIMEKGARHYMEVSLSATARKLGYTELAEKYKTASAIVPLRNPQRGMKVRIDGRTFVNYAEYDSGIAVPSYLAKATGRKHRTFIPMDNMILNFC